MSTYMQNHAIVQELSRIRRNDPECTIYGLWNSILALQFPIVQGYVTRPQDEHTLLTGEKGFSDLHVFHYRGAATSANKFLIVQCKRYDYEGWPTVWTEGVDQLNDYLSATHRRRGPARRTPVYGIVAIGRRMRVYKYSDQLRSVQNWAPSGLQPGKPWHLKDDASQVQQILDHILNNH
ncbi:uncharacterized protein N7459_001564 [Penicillium hispanicum]|uniref:uncharacterized protein n=1 Tax=Penicillium hispanicum TaxID=1080232 RepID=UPI002540AFA8|nr:uncharacterized protein N7459_001564 [Penicillium hispanicum]KAJ5595356.1 hypothetical protein N7459_001564 [Penicillium hispanicum]